MSIEIESAILLEECEVTQIPFHFSPKFRFYPPSHGFGWTVGVQRGEAQGHWNVTGDIQGISIFLLSLLNDSAARMVMPRVYGRAGQPAGIYKPLTTP